MNPVTRGRRRSLTHVGGEATLTGDRGAAALLAQALDVRSAEDDDDDLNRAHVHGFHAYPARTHPITARRLIDSFAPAGPVLDPFCGSGTVLLEAMCAGRDSVGTDLNALAIELARVKTRLRTAEETTRLVTAAHEVRAFADARRLARAGATRRLPQADLSWFAPHVILELDGIRAGIEAAPAEHRADLYLVLSSILVKLAARKADTSQAPETKRLAAGYPAKLFLRKTEELSQRLDELGKLVPTPPPSVRIVRDDATKLARIAKDSIAAVITSPPYVATYDYLAHHELRMRWLGLDGRALAAGEFGARRRYQALAPAEARRAWQHELEALFRALERVTRKDASIVLLIADSAIGRGREAQALRAEELVSTSAARAGLQVVAVASQARPHFHGPTEGAFRDGARREHGILVRR